MRFAYADPPYLGMCGRYEHVHEGDFLAGCWDDIQTHGTLIGLLNGFDAWALSASSVSLRQLLPLCPNDVRIGAWVKPWASFKKGVNPAFTWEPVIFRGARTWKDRGGSDAVTTRDWVSVVAHQRGFFGSKPPAFCRWVFDLLGATPADEFVDLFPGTGTVWRSWQQWCAERPLDFGASA